MADNLNRQKKKNFSAKETEALLYKWGSEEMQKKFQEAYKHNILWNEIANELKLFERTPSELRTRVSNLKKEYFKLKRTLKPGSPFPDWPYWKLMHSILGRRSLPDKRYTMDSLDIEIKREGNASEICNENNINIENSLEIEIEGQESNFSKFSIEDLNNVEDKLKIDNKKSDVQRNSSDVANNITEADDRRSSNINNSDMGRELESPLPSDSASAASDLAFSALSASSDEEMPKSNHQNKRTKKRKTAEKDAIQKLLEAEKRSYELQWKKLQIEIEVAKSMKTFFSSMANMMDRILKPQSSTSAQPSQTFSQPFQNTNWTIPPANYYPFPFIPNYSQPMPFPPFYQPYSSNNQNNSQNNFQNNDTNCSTDVNNVSKERNEENKTS
ncbi:putative uncharacterized protein DDB_G0291812 isoform X2 [Centruroides vittatus]|uniref:putative uncharacterized protein DDB_G0291812 isoform X2 n=1 Tax=Centruroides vittatus TaxID=120091 RepID=UPI00350F2959